MKDPQRYWMYLSAPSGGIAQMIADDDKGDWVNYRDYVKLKAEMSDTKYHQALSANRKLVEEIDRLKSENERLRNAGDNLERLLTTKIASYEIGNASNEWHFAKGARDAK